MFLKNIVYFITYGHFKVGFPANKKFRKKMPKISHFFAKINGAKMKRNSANIFIKKRKIPEIGIC